MDDSLGSSRHQTIVFAKDDTQRDSGSTLWLMKSKTNDAMWLNAVVMCKESHHKAEMFSQSSMRCLPLTIRNDRNEAGCGESKPVRAIADGDRPCTRIAQESGPRKTPSHSELNPSDRP